MDKQKDIGLVGQLVKACEEPAAVAVNPADLPQGEYNIAIVFTCAVEGCGNTQAITDPGMVIPAIEQGAVFVMRCQKCGAQQMLKPAWSVGVEERRIVDPHGKLMPDVLARFKRAMK